MNILLVATKAPWPPVDGGRFLLLNTLEALAAAGCRLTLVTPVDPAGFDLGRVARELSPWCAAVVGGCGWCGRRFPGCLPARGGSTAIRRWSSSAAAAGCRTRIPWPGI